MISLREAVKLSPYSQEYLGLLVRKGKMYGEKVGGKIYTTESALKDYIRQAAIAKQEYQQRFNVEIPPEEAKQPLSLKWRLALLGVAFLLVLVGGVIFWKIRDDQRSETIRNKYTISEDNDGHITLYADFPEKVKSVEVKKKN